MLVNWPEENCVHNFFSFISLVLMVYKTTQNLCNVEIETTISNPDDCNLNYEHFTLRHPTRGIGKPILL